MSEIKDWKALAQKKQAETDEAQALQRKAEEEREHQLLQQNIETATAMQRSHDALALLMRECAKISTAYNEGVTAPHLRLRLNEQLHSAPPMKLASFSVWKGNGEHKAHFNIHCPGEVDLHVYDSDRPSTGLKVKYVVDNAGRLSVSGEERGFSVQDVASLACEALIETKSAQTFGYV